MDAKGNIRETREALGHAGVEVPAHHVEALLKMCEKARKEYFRSSKQGLPSTTAMACAESVQRATIVDVGRSTKALEEELSRRVSGAAMAKIRRGRDPRRGIH